MPITVCVTRFGRAPNADSPDLNRGACRLQGYTALVREALRQLPAPPTHVFLQAGVGGLAAAVAGHLALVLGDPGQEADG